MCIFSSPHIPDPTPTPAPVQPAVPAIPMTTPETSEEAIGVATDSKGNLRLGKKRLQIPLNSGDVKSGLGVSV